MAIQETETLTVSIDAEFSKVAADLADPATHPAWAHRFFAGPATPTSSPNEVLVPVPMMGGTMRYRIEADTERGLFELYLAPQNAAFGSSIPVRLIRNRDGVDVLWTLSRMPGTPDAAWKAGQAAMADELQALKARHESTTATAGARS